MLSESNIDVEELLASHGQQLPSWQCNVASSIREQERVVDDDASKYQMLPSAGCMTTYSNNLPSTHWPRSTVTQLLNELCYSWKPITCMSSCYLGLA